MRHRGRPGVAFTAVRRGESFNEVPTESISFAEVKATTGILPIKMRRTNVAVLPIIALLGTRVGAFFPRWTRSSLFTRTALSALPSIEQLSKDPFMKQIGHASDIVPLLSMEDNDELLIMLEAQLSHPDGMRGFFVCYLTGEGTTVADAPHIPPPLAAALKSVPGQNDLLSLASMNVIMPTAMSTMHTDKILQEASAKTALRGIKVFNYLAKIYPVEVKAICDAILAAVNADGSSDEIQVAYWKKFFVSYAYQDQQSQDIRSAVVSIDC